MSYQVLARKWRPKTFNDVVGQDPIVRVLQNSINKEQVAHAYLFCGTRGVGKTSMARIFSKTLCCESPTPQGPCLQCDSCLSIDHDSSLDYIEIDGASHNSVDHIRDLIDNVQFLPTKGQYKVYVIDEVHMLSTSAFNALLKTLEEPPAHVVFIFATTDPQKLLDTVISRCQRVDFLPVPALLLEEHLKNICEVEKIIFEDLSLLRLIAHQAQGSIRDALSLLDQARAIGDDSGKINEESLLYSLGVVSSTALDQIIIALLNSDFEQLRDLYKQSLAHNIDIEKFSFQISNRLFEVLEHFQIHKKFLTGFEELSLQGVRPLAELIWVYEALAKDLDWAMKSFDPERNVQLALSKVCLRGELFGKKTTPSADNSKKKVKDSPQVIKPAILKEEKMLRPQSWEDFLHHLFSVHKALAVNLERGNLMHKLDLSTSEIRLVIGFKQDGEVFFDYCSAPDTKQKLEGLFAHYFERNRDDVSIRFEIVKPETGPKDFKTRVEISEEKIENAKEKRRSELLTNTYIQQAQKLFRGHIDGVILKEEQQI